MGKMVDGFMTEWADHALVLRIGHFRESDLWLKMLCRKHGLLTLFAFGGSRSRRRFCGCLDVLNSLHCRVKASGRGSFLNLEEAVLLGGPQSLRGNWRRMESHQKSFGIEGANGELLPHFLTVLNLTPEDMPICWNSH